MTRSVSGKWGVARSARRSSAKLSEDRRVDQFEKQKSLFSNEDRWQLWMCGYAKQSRLSRPAFLPWVEKFIFHLAKKLMSTNISHLNSALHIVSLLRPTAHFDVWSIPKPACNFSSLTGFILDSICLPDFRILESEYPVPFFLGGISKFRKGRA